MTEAQEIAARLSEAQREALLTLPLPRGGNPVKFIAERPYSSTWRKSAKHWNALLSLERLGVVQRKVSRNETLWRLIDPLGLEVRRLLTEKPE